MAAERVRFVGIGEVAGHNRFGPTIEGDVVDQWRTWGAFLRDR
ncbi:hypothetical protein ACFZAV_21930 [Streptomyces sp. NPDC008343]